MKSQKKRRESIVEKIIDKAFRRAKQAQLGDIPRDKIQLAKKRELKRVETVKNVVQGEIDRLLSLVPDERTMHDFYKDLMNLLVGLRDIKKARIRLNYIKSFLNDLYIKYRNSIRITRDPKKMAELRREFYGRVASLLRRNKKHFDILFDASNTFRKLPVVKPYPTAVISGLPNVGKSTLLRKLTGSEPEVQPYPFTTKDLMLGYVETPYFTIQFIDTPGMLDRPFEEMNEIEKRALLALKHLANVIVYVFDLTERCGYTIEQQKKMMDQIKRSFRKTMFIYLSKTDLFDEKEKKLAEEFKTKFNRVYDDHQKLLQDLIEFIKKKPEWYV